MTSMRALAWLGLFAVAGCAEPTTPPSPDAPASIVCVDATDCDDGHYCNGEERCAPDDPAAGDDGCAPPTAPPCETGCDEATDSCDACAEPDADGDGEARPGCGGDDCDDDDPARFHGNAETCDADDVDEDCNGATFGELDSDGDFYFDARCCNGATCGDDCDDARAGTNPASPEVCDARDNDCDTRTDEEVTVTCYADADDDGYAPAGATTTVDCTCPVHYTLRAPEGDLVDCDDTVASISPEGTEVCDGDDNDCDGATDEMWLVSCWADADDDGYAPMGATEMMLCACGPGTTSRAPTATSFDCDDTNVTVNPTGREECTANSLDDDCDGTVDDLGGDDYYRDCDEDGYGARMSTPVRSCGGPPMTVPGCGGGGGWSRSADDCLDTSPDVRPGTLPGDTVPAEACDGVDNDCNGATPDGRSEVSWWAMPCDGADGDLCREGIYTCGAGGVDMVCSDPAGETDVELCGGGDQDCDATVDEAAAANADCLARGLPPHVASTVCSAGACTIASCESGHYDCSAGAGCESACAWRGCSGGGCDDAIGVATFLDSTRVASCAARRSGSVVCWGRALDGSTASAPIVASGVSGVARVDGRWALTTGGRVFRQQGSPGFRYAELTGLGTVTGMGVLLQDGGRDQGCFLRSDRTVICSNYAMAGNRGDGVVDTGAGIGLGVVSGLTDAVEVVGTYYGGCARRAGGTVVCWGGNHWGQLGDGVAAHRTCMLGSGVTFDCSATFVTVAGITNAAEIAPVGDGAGYCARLATGEVRCWGSGSGPRAPETCSFGGGTTGCSHTPVSVAGLTATRFFPSSGSPIVLTTTGALVQILADNTLAATPALPGMPADFEHRDPGPPHIGSCALVGGAVYCQGSNSFAEIGDGTTTARASFVPVLSPP